jgi:hypothetical protein
VWVRVRVVVRRERATRQKELKCREIFEVEVL